jgi:hypothetical protein
MNLTTSIAAALAAFAVATGSATADDGPSLTAGTDCSVQCIKKALVTPTAGSAKVEIQTTVTASVTVYVRPKPAAHTDIDLTGQEGQTVHFSVPGGLTRARTFSDLKPDTEYSIWAQATDGQGHSSTRTGTFKTLAVKTNGIGGPGTIDPGVGCPAKCVTKALFTQAPPDGSVVNVEVNTNTDATIGVVVSRDMPIGPADNPAWQSIAATISSPGGFGPGDRYVKILVLTTVDIDYEWPS